MRKKIIKSIFTSLVATLAVVFVSLTVTGTTYTKKYGDSKHTINGFGTYYEFSHTFVAATDTVICKLPVVPPAFWTNSDTVLYICQLKVVSTGGVNHTAANGDSTVIGVRFRTSMDETNFKATTIGTDSSSWASAVTTTTPFTVSAPMYNGVFAYPQIMIVGQTGNLIGNSFVLDVIPKHQ